MICTWIIKQWLFVVSASYLMMKCYFVNDELNDGVTSCWNYHLCNFAILNVYKIIYAETVVKKFSFRELASLRYDQEFIQLFWQYSVFVLMSEFLQPKFIEAGSRGAGAVNPHCGVHWQSPWKLCYFEAPELFCLWFWSAWCQHHKHFQCMSKLLHESKNLHKHKE